MGEQTSMVDFENICLIIIMKYTKRLPKKRLPKKRLPKKDYQKKDYQKKD